MNLAMFPASPGLIPISCGHQIPCRSIHPHLRRSLYFAIGAAMLVAGLPAIAKQKGAMSDEDILNPNQLIFNRVVPFIDSFDGSKVGTVFVTKRATLGHPTKGTFGERCAAFCPAGTNEIDASYVYVFQKKGECVIGVRGIGWGIKVERSSQGQQYETGRIRYQSNAVNIAAISVNGISVGPPTNQSQLAPPNGTNYKYYPRRQHTTDKLMGSILRVTGLLSGLMGGGKASTSSDYDIFSSTNEGYITDIHYFPARELVKAAKQGDDLLIELPSWQPSRHVIDGQALAELRQLTATCEND
jgi:hypothetical protein